MSQELAKKKKIRAGHRGHANKIVAEAENEMLKFNPSPVELEHYIQILTDKELFIKNLDEEIVSLVDDGDIETEIFDSEDKRSEIRKAIVKLREKSKAISQTSSHAGSTASNTETSSLPTNSNRYTPKLPKLELPKYNGDPRKWNEWWDVYVSAIDSNETLSPVYKLRHLKTLVEGPAAATISGLALTSANYSEAIDFLKARFAQKQVIINAHVEALLKINQAPMIKDIKSLRKLYDEIETNIRSLKSLGVQSEQYGTLLIPVVMSKLPEEIRLAISKSLNKENWELDKILELFSSELEARERCNQTVLGQRPLQNSSRPISHTTTSALLANGGNASSVTCSYCRNKHLSAKCPTVTEPGARKEILKKQGQCFVCLKKGHLFREYKSNVRCFNCKNRHHNSICEAPYATPRFQHNPRNQNSTQVHSAVNTSNRNESLRPQASTQPQNPNDISSTTTMFVDAKNSVLLQTAKGYISAVDNLQNSIIARMILDNGSQKSYISQELRDKLRFPTLSRETLSIKTFGSDQGSFQTCDMTQIAIRSPYTEEILYVNVHVVPVVCAPLPGYKRSCEHLSTFTGTAPRRL